MSAWERELLWESRSVNFINPLSVSLNCRCYFCKEIAILFNNNETPALHSKRWGGLLAPTLLSWAPLPLGLSLG